MDDGRPTAVVPGARRGSRVSLRQVPDRPRARSEGGPPLASGLRPPSGNVDLQSLNSSLIHHWYDFPQHFPAELVWCRITAARLATGATVLDPFCGSGTTLCTAKLLGLRAVGVDANPLLAYVSASKATWDVDLSAFRQRADTLLDRITDYRVGSPANRSEYVELIGMPADRLAKWLDDDVLDEAIVASRRLASEPLDPIRGLLALAFSKSLYDASKVKYCPGITFLKRRKAPSLHVALERRLSRIEADLSALHQLRDRGDLHLGSVDVHTGDARLADALVPAESIDFIFTSPPYPGDVEYTRLFRLELHFLGFVHDRAGLQSVKRRLVRGSPKNIFKDDRNELLVADVPAIREVSDQIAERVKDKQWGWDYPRMVREYFGDMWVALRAFHSVLAPGAEAQLVVGDQTVKGVAISTGAILRDLGERLGYRDTRLDLYRYRRASTHGRPLAEWIVCLRR